MRRPGHRLIVLVLLLGAGGLALYPALSSRREATEATGLSPLPPGKSIERPRDAKDRRAVSAPAKAVIRSIRELMARADYGEMDVFCMKTFPELIARGHLGAADLEAILRDPEIGWPPLTGIIPTAEAESTERAVARSIHSQILKRWGELDLAGALATFEAPYKSLPDWDLAASLFVKPAALDPEDTYRQLLDWTKGGDLFSIPLFIVMKEWAAVDSERAWQVASNLPLDMGWQQSVRGYFSGLPASQSWREVREKVDAFVGEDVEPGGLNSAGFLRQEFVKQWLRHDPGSALAWYQPHAGTFIYNRANIDALPAGETYAGHDYAALIAEWMEYEPVSAREWLTNWKPTEVDADEIFDIISNKWDCFDTTRAQAKALIRDPDWRQKKVASTPSPRTNSDSIGELPLTR